MRSTDRIKLTDAPDYPCGCVELDGRRALNDVRAMAAEVLLGPQLRDNPQLRDFALDVISRIKGL